MTTDKMPKTKSGGDKKHGDAEEPLPVDERSSPGSGEDRDEGEAADLQPDEVEQDDPAR
jgi:hypothetical protein